MNKHIVKHIVGGAPHLIFDWLPHLPALQQETASYPYLKCDPYRPSIQRQPQEDEQQL